MRFAHFTDVVYYGELEFLLNKREEKRLREILVDSVCELVEENEWITRYL